MFIERIISSYGEPNKNDLWLDLKTNTLKHYYNGEWVEILSSGSDSGGGDEGGGGCDCPQIVTITGLEGTLSSGDLGKVKGDNCLLVYDDSNFNGKIYMVKASEAADGVCYCGLMPYYTDDGGIAPMRLFIDKSTGIYEIQTEGYIIPNVDLGSYNATALENIVIGDEIYGPFAILVEGTLDEEDGFFTISDSSDYTFDELWDKFKKGYVITFKYQDSNGYELYTRAVQLLPETPRNARYIVALGFEGGVLLQDPDYIQPVG